MPKIKIRKSAAKRFKVTKNGKIMFGHQNAGHLKMHKSAKQKRRQKEPAVLTGIFAKKVKKMLAI